MDPLSDVLSMLKVSSALSTRFEGRGDWAFRFPGYAAQIKFGGVLAGGFHLSMEGEGEGTQAPVRLETGDFYLLTNGQPFRIGSDASVPAQEVAAFRAHREADGVVRIGSDGPLVSLASGSFVFDGEVGELLLRHVPPFIHLRASDPGTRPLAGLLDLLRWEVEAARPGALVASESLAALVLVQALRVFLAHAPQPEGWLGAMCDARVGSALSAMHGDLSQRWTVERLAAAAGMSRTAFAVRFKQLVGLPPLDYLGGWRMTVARNALRKGDEPMAGIAQRIGYQSDTAFSAAFKRATGHSPGRFRREARV